MLNRLCLRHFKCFENIDLSLKPLSVLCGLNGMGKSTVVQSLLLLRQSYLQGFIQTQGLVLNGELIHLGTGQDILFDGADDDQIEIAIESHNNNLRWLVNCQPEADLLGYAKEYQAGEQNLSALSLFDSSFQYLKAERIGPRVSTEKADYAVRHHRCLGMSGEFAAHFMSVYGEDKLQNKLLQHPNSVGESVKANVEAWMGEVSPGVQIDYEDYPGIDQVSMRFRFLDGEALTGYFRSTNVGFGISYTLPIIVAILSANPGALLLLENPEAHLHPRGQRRIGELIALASKCNIQILVETHSDHILNGIRIAAKNKSISPDDTIFHYFQRETLGDQMKNIVIQPKLDSDGRFDEWPHGFFDEWDNALDQLL